MLRCSYCSKEFKYKSEKKRHEQSHIPQFECKECCKKFSFVSALKRHQKQHERTCSVVCSKCGHSFRDDTLLKRHMKYAHKGIHVCSKCDAKLNSEQALSSHMKSHKPKSDRNLKCSYIGCNKSFNFTHHLKHHELTHTNEKQHSCKICGKGFIQLHHLKSHLKTHSSKDWFNCSVQDCNKKFSTENSRKRHLATHKITADSGISSDSNCDIFQDSTRDSIHCLECGQMVALSLYDLHKEKCEHIKEIPKDTSVKLLTSTEYNNNDTTDEPEFSNCKTILGRCIVSGDSLGNSCLCAQIKTDVDFYDVASPTEPVNAQNEAKSVEFLTNKEVTNNLCESCECSSVKGCNIQRTNLHNKDDFPPIEYRNDGIIKIKDVFDIEITYINNHERETNELFKSNNFVPFNSCKAVLGKCIVSGNGTMNEECLCAKMAMDDQTIIAQEIDEITPQPMISTS